MQGVVGKAGVEQINTMVNAANKQGRGIWATAIGVVVLLVGATGVVAQLQATLNRVWDVKADPRRGGIMRLVRKRLLSFAMILGVGFLLAVSLVLTTVLSAIGERMRDWLPSGVSGGLLFSLDVGASLIVFALLFAAMFKWLPDAKVRWRDVALGAIVTSALFIAGKFLLGFYLGRQDTSAYGPAAALVLILIWVYYSAMILFFGAEFTQVWARRHGARIEPAEGAVRIEQDESRLSRQTS
jgi:membrane protein